MAKIARLFTYASSEFAQLPKQEGRAQRTLRSSPERISLEGPIRIRSGHVAQFHRRCPAGELDTAG